MGGFVNASVFDIHDISTQLPSSCGGAALRVLVSRGLVYSCGTDAPAGKNGIPPGSCVCGIKVNIVFSIGMAAGATGGAAVGGACVGEWLAVAEGSARPVIPFKAAETTEL